MRVLLRFLGLILVAAGFVVGVIDGTRSIADSALVVTPLGTTLRTAFGGRVDDAALALGRNVHPLLADPVATAALAVPTALAALGLGLLLLWLGRRPQPVIGFDTKR